MRRFISPIKLVALKELGDRSRSGWVIACIVVWLGAIGFTSFLGLLQVGQIGVQGYDRTVVSLLNLVQYLVPLLGLLLGHDLIVGEYEERTLRLVLAGGVSRTQFLLGKLFGGWLVLAVPLLLGFSIAGSAIGVAARDGRVAPFLQLAFSGLVLGMIFLAAGLAISVVCRTRMQSLVAVLLVWCFAIFVFDLVALGFFVSSKVPSATQEIDFVCDTVHVNTSVDLHSDFNDVATTPTHAAVGNQESSLGWLALNPIDWFRAVNLSERLAFHVPVVTTFAAVALWFSAAFGVSVWRFRRVDL